MYRSIAAKRIGFTIEITLMDGKVKFEECGELSSDYGNIEGEIAKAEAEIRMALEKTYNLVFRKLTSPTDPTSENLFADVGSLRGGSARPSEDITDRWTISVLEAARLLGVGR